MIKRSDILKAMVLLSAFGLLAGCGSSSSSSTPTAPVTTTSTPATVTAGTTSGTVVTTAKVEAASAPGAPVALTIPAGATITPSGGTLGAGPMTVNVNTFDFSKGALKVSPTQVLTNAGGYVDLGVTGTTGFTVGGTGADIKIPVSPSTYCPSATGVPVTVTLFHSDGTSDKKTGSCANNVVTVTGVTKFSAACAPGYEATTISGECTTTSISQYACFNPIFTPSSYSATNVPIFVPCLTTGSTGG